MAKFSANTPRRVAVIGAGWAGCAAAVELARHGISVSLIEASRNLGGRARGVSVNGLELDNGQHILLGAYSSCLQLMRKLDIDTGTALLKLPLQMVYPDNEDGMRFIAPRLPAPLHLLFALWTAKGLQRGDKMALARFSTTARWMGWQLHQDCSVSELLERFEQTPRLCRLMWHPLCIAALNTPPERASAQVFLNVLRDSLGARRAASDMLLPRTDLSAILPARAAAFVTQHGGQTLLASAVSSLHHTENGQWQLNTRQNASVDTAPPLYDGVIIATDVATAERLLQTLASPPPSLPDYSYEAITTCYLQYAATVRLRRAMLALLDDAGQKKWGQYVFDRGQLHQDQAGLLAVVISASNQACELAQEELAKDVASQLAESLQMPELAKPLWHKCISEKRATFSCTPGLVRPENRTDLPGLYLAGDYTKGDYPATLEGAVRSGIAASQCVLAGFKQTSK
ncbi:hydroxysqualene dehydroxylase HpnE [Undibacterium sp. TJN19]|uniref:hydroxysqualene dehydroxylase HpnE n=1 Tax=Undibacterium sp. TJN19 TaxID=3413055 RepID=UPI003BF2FA51